MRALESNVRSCARIVASRRAGLAERLSEGFGDLPHALLDGARSNPAETAMRQAVNAYRAFGADALIALRGNSSMDLASGLVIAATHDEPLAHYAAIEGGSRRIQASVAPQVPTTTDDACLRPLSESMDGQRGEKLAAARQLTRVLGRPMPCY